MIDRQAASALKKLSLGYPVLVVTGPRQSGKTTLVKSLFGGDRPYYNLENLEILAFASQDPKGFLATMPQGGIIDECQLCPSLFPYIQQIVDERRRMGDFILTGSQNFDLQERVSESLAGRASIVDLLPLTSGELEASHKLPRNLDEVLFKGFYPALYSRTLEPVDWYEDYVRTYVERDVRRLINVSDLSLFQRFLRLCAGRVGQVLNYSSLQVEAGISFVTLKKWLTVLEASYLVFLLQPHHENYSKRLIKAPKLYFYDTGLMCRLLGIQSSDQLTLHPARGFIFESFVISEIKKLGFNRHLPFPCYFWRDNKGVEVDLLIEHALALQAVEIKSGATLQDEFFGNIQTWSRLAGSRSVNPTLVYGGDLSQSRYGIQVQPWTAIPKIVGL